MNALDNNQKTPIYRVIHIGLGDFFEEDTDIVKLLIQKGAHVHVTSAGSW